MKKWIIFSGTLLIFYLLIGTIIFMSYDSKKQTVELSELRTTNQQLLQRVFTNYQNGASTQNGASINTNLPHEDFYIVDESHSLESNTVYDCQGKSVKPTTQGNLTFGLYISQNKSNIIIRNCKIELNGTNEANFGIFIYDRLNDTQNIRIVENEIKVNEGYRVRAISIIGGHDINIENNLLEVRGNRTYGIRIQGDNNNILIKNNIVNLSLIDNGAFVTPIQPSNWVNKYAHNITIESNTIYCDSYRQGLDYGLYIADTRLSKIINNKLFLRGCSPLISIRSTHNEIWNNSWEDMDGKINE